MEARRRAMRWIPVFDGVNMKLTKHTPLTPQEFRRLLGARIRTLRGEANQLEFATIHGIHPSMLSRIETGQSDLSLQRAQQLALALGTTVDELLEGLI
jgi:plasmid maintenance system antidote protein VapI